MGPASVFRFIELSNFRASEALEKFRCSATAIKHSNCIVFIKSILTKQKNKLISIKSVYKV